MTGWTVPCTFVHTNGDSFWKTAVISLEKVDEPDGSKRFELDIRFEGTSRNVLVRLEDFEKMYSAIAGRAWSLRKKEQES
jgi:hypothetical protein